MAGCNTRMIYDKQAFQERIEQSKKPGSYKLNEQQNSNDKACFASNGPRSTRFYASNEIPEFRRADRVEIESLLTGRSFKNAKYMNGRTVGERNKSLSKFKGKVQKECGNISNITSTRLDNPAMDVREVDITNYHMDFPIINPKEYVFYGNNKNTRDSQRFGVNTQLQARDNFKN